mmetsp:Transcript_3834/g.11296  ORF Transcript_3834/g.11296 Transcript_3834/m.11296 type:complete len:230 (+) Transcript_3834:1194-1883(+)
MAGRCAYLCRSSFSRMTNSPPSWCCMDAVPRRTSRPMDVSGREVPGRLPCIAVATSRPAEELVGRFVPGRAKPVSGRPLALTGRTTCEGPPEESVFVSGRLREVPGRGACATAFSSMRMSATPSSSISTSSIHCLQVSARHFRNHTAWSRGFLSRSSEQRSMQSSHLRWRNRLTARKNGLISSLGSTAFMAATGRRSSSGEARNDAPDGGCRASARTPPVVPSSALIGP